MRLLRKAEGLSLILLQLWRPVHPPAFRPHRRSVSEFRRNLYVFQFFTVHRIKHRLGRCTSKNLSFPRKGTDCPSAQKHARNCIRTLPGLLAEEGSDGIAWRLTKWGSHLLGQFASYVAK
jgi:hypothetical protein